MIQKAIHEKRRAERFTTQAPAKLKNMTGSSWYPITIINLSKTGACVTGTFSRKVGSLVEIIVSSAGRSHFVVAQIVWSDDNKAGVKFHS